MILRCAINNEEEQQLKNDLIERMSNRSAQVREIEDNLPKSNGLYLRIVMGGINASFLDSEQKFKYKEQYERFKLVVNMIIFLICFLDIAIHYRFAIFLIINL